MQQANKDLVTDLSAPVVSVKVLIASFFLFVAAIVISYYYLDTRVALFFDRVVKSNEALASHVSNIPDMLEEIVIGVTGFSWVVQLYLRRKGIYDICTRFFQLIGITVPASFILKDIFKEIFGRTNTEVWLSSTVVHGFHWLEGGGSFNGFPSGHMAAFTPIALALWRFYPRFRMAYLGFLLLLGTALIAAGYHFLSDVIAGACLGWLIDLAANRTLFLLLGKSGCVAKRHSHEY